MNALFLFGSYSVFSVRSVVCLKASTTEHTENTEQEEQDLATFKVNYHDRSSLTAAATDPVRWGIIGAVAAQVITLSAVQIDRRHPASAV